jgi:integrase
MYNKEFAMKPKSTSKRIERKSKYGINQNKFLTDLEIQKLKVNLSTLKLKSPKYALYFELCLATGGRCSEVLSLQRSDINLESMAILVPGLKGSDDREIPIEGSLWLELLAYIEGLQGAELFDFSDRYARKLWCQVKPSAKSLHSLRHTFGINAYRKTRDLRVVQFALGHKQINNTMVYASYVFGQEELRRLLL